MDIVISVRESYVDSRGYYDPTDFLTGNREELKKVSVEDLLERSSANFDRWLTENCSNEPQSSLTSFGCDLDTDYTHMVNEIYDKVSKARSLIREGDRNFKNRVV